MRELLCLKASTDVVDSSCVMAYTEMRARRDTDAAVCLSEFACETLA